MVSRRKFMQASAVGGAVALAPSFVAKKAFALTAPAPLDATTQIPFQFTNLLSNPLAPSFNFLPTGVAQDPNAPTKLIAKYDLEIKQTTAQIGLRTPAGALLPPTTVWGYGTRSQAASYPGRTFQVPKGSRIQVSYTNKLVKNGAFINYPESVPIDTTIDWANPGNAGALAPVPLVAHLHGSDSAYTSDGLPDAWELADGTPAPAAPNFPGVYSKPYYYDNNQEAGHLWYHDHALGVTRNNVYMGLAGNYFIRGLDEVLLAAQSRIPAYPYEVPLVIQDRMFLDNGQLFYPSTGDGVDPADPYNQFAPTHLPEFFGDVMLVNGQAWPKLDVEPRRYRLRLLNGSDSRFYALRFETFANNASIVAGSGLSFAKISVIGNELGLLNAPVLINATANNPFVIGPGERYDIVVDFTGAAQGTKFTMTNAANAPFPDADPPVLGLSDRIMQFQVTKALNASRPNRTLPSNLRPVSGPLPAMPAPVRTRKILLVEGTDPVGRLMTMLGPIDPNLPPAQQGTLFYNNGITERPNLGDTEIWEFYNCTVDAHPIHMHLVDFRILNRQAFDTAAVQLEPKTMREGIVGGTLNLDKVDFTGQPVPVAPNAEEAGKKDTAIMYPGTVTRLLVSFKRRGEYVYHCHILSHEDHEMMRPYQVV